MLCCVCVHRQVPDRDPVAGADGPAGGERVGQPALPGGSRLYPLGPGPTFRGGGSALRCHGRGERAGLD